MKPLVSILIPAYNSGRWLRETLDSATWQSWPAKEVIVVDDGSSDDSFEIAKRYQCRSVKAVTQENAGACAARNHALSLAQGDYIQWLDADDLLAPDKIEQQMKEAQRQGNDRVLLSSAFGTFYFRTQKAQFTPSPLWEDLAPVEWFTRKYYHDVSLFPAVWLVSRKLTDQAGLWDQRLTLDDDGEYFSRVISASQQVKFVAAAKSFYRQANQKSISKTVNHSSCLSLLRAYRLAIGRFLALEDSETTREAVLRHLQANLIYFYPEEEQLIEELRQWANRLGGTLSPPEFSSKYALVNRYLGLRRTKNLAAAVRGVKHQIYARMDRLLMQLDSITRR
jgi:glycosyltransferase involved in cell wall biosynthesis